VDSETALSALSASLAKITYILSSWQTPCMSEVSIIHHVLCALLQVADEFFWYALAVACFVAWKAFLARWVCDEYLVHERLALGGPLGEWGAELRKCPPAWLPLPACALRQNAQHITLLSRQLRQGMLRCRVSMTIGSSIADIICLHNLFGIHAFPSQTASKTFPRVAPIILVRHLAPHFPAQAPASCT
jgi:hypothetical protein